MSSPEEKYRRESPPAKEIIKDIWLLWKSEEYLEDGSKHRSLGIRHCYFDCTAHVIVVK